MSNRSAHISAGCLSAATVYLALVEIPENPLEFIAIIGAGYFGGRMPDLLEPATNPNHRQFFHCVAVLLLLAYGIKLLMDWKPKDDWQKLGKILLMAAAVGYISHLVLDGMTPKGLPLLA